MIHADSRARIKPGHDDVDGALDDNENCWICGPPARLSAMDEDQTFGLLPIATRCARRVCFRRKGRRWAAEAGSRSARPFRCVDRVRRGPRILASRDLARSGAAHGRPIFESGHFSRLKCSSANHRGKSHAGSAWRHGRHAHTVGQPPYRTSRDRYSSANPTFNVT